MIIFISLVTHYYFFTLWYDEVRRRIQPDWTQRNLPDHFGPRSWSSGRAQGSKSSSSWFPFHPGLFPAFSPESAIYPLFSFCKKSFLEVKNVSNKSKSLKNDHREYAWNLLHCNVRCDLPFPRLRIWKKLSWSPPWCKWRDLEDCSNIKNREQRSDLTGQILRGWLYCSASSGCGF